MKYEHPLENQPHVELKVEVTNPEVVPEAYQIHLVFLNLNGSMTSERVIHKGKNQEHSIRLNLEQKIAHLMVRTQHKTEKTAYHYWLQRINRECFHSSFFGKQSNCQKPLDVWEDVYVQRETWLDFADPVYLPVDLIPQLGVAYRLQCAFHPAEITKDQRNDPITGKQYFFDKPYLMHHQLECTFKEG